MSIRTWSLTRFWAVCALTWLAALVVGAASSDGGGGRLLALTLACVPAFLAGSWAASHPEIRDWPVIRLIALWGFPLVGLAGLGDLLRYSGSAASIVLAPVAVLTVRWIELRSVRPLRVVPTPPPLVNTPIPATTPTSGTKID